MKKYIWEDLEVWGERELIEKVLELQDKIFEIPLEGIQKEIKEHKDYLSETLSDYGNNLSEQLDNFLSEYAIESSGDFNLIEEVQYIQGVIAGLQQADDIIKT